MDWLAQSYGQVLDLTWRHLILAGLPLLIGLAVALPLGYAAHRWRAAYAPLVTVSGLLYTIPSLALFILMPLFIGTRILDPVNVVVAMTVYTVALLVRTVADGLASVPEDVERAATAMGLGRIRTLLTVELPLAIPVIAAGLRVAAVASLIGVAQLGDLLTDGYNRVIMPELVTGIMACILLALALDSLILVLARVLTPWRRAREVVSA